MTVTIDGDLDAGLLRVHIPWDRHNVRKRLKNSIGQRRWNDPRKTWDIPASPIQAEQLEAWAKRENVQYGWKVDVTDAAHELVDRVREKWDGKGTDIVVNVPGNDVLYPFQRMGIEYTKHWGSSLLAFDVGTGKTITSLKACTESNWLPILAVVPASVKLQWAREVRKWYGDDLDIVILDGMWDGEEEIPDADIVIVNYSLLADRAKPKKLQEGPNDTVYKGWNPVLCDYGFESVIFDEIHYCASSESARSCASLQLAEQIPHVIGLSGTPIINSPADLPHPLNMLGVLEYWGGEWAFLHEHINVRKRKRRDGREWTDLSQPKNLDKLHERLEKFVMVRVKKEDVIDELPPLTMSLVPIEISNRAEYERAEEEFIDWVAEKAREDDEVREALANGDQRRAQRLIDGIVARAVAGGEMVKKGKLMHVVGQGKVKTAIELAENAIKDGDKPIIFTKHRDTVLNAISNGLRNRGYEVARLDGTMGSQERQDNIDAFQGGVAEAFCATIQAGGTGLTLTEAHAIIFAELPWTAKDVTQGVGRCYARLNDMHGVNVMFLLGDKTVDYDTWQNILKKADIVKDAIDGGEGGLDVEVEQGVGRRADDIWERVSGG